MTYFKADLKLAKLKMQHSKGVIRCSCRGVQDFGDRDCDGRTQVAHTPGKRCETCEIRYVQSAILLMTLDTTCSQAGKTDSSRKTNLRAFKV
jgi:hypothetical protein